MKALEKLKDYIEDENRLGDLNYAHYSNIIDYVNEAIKELEDLQSRSCENCYESKTCKILHYVYKDRLKKEGYAMHKNEFKCGFWHSLF